MKIVSADEMRALDRRAIEGYGISGETLMEAAGRGLADAVRRLADEHGLVDAPVLLLAGPGNNGGDVFVAARVLHEADWAVDCLLSVPPEKLRGDALRHFEGARESDVPFRVLPTPEDWQAELDAPPPAEILVDGLLGTGATGEPRGATGAAVRFADAMADQSLVIAVDVPSAMSVRADVTVAMGLPKTACVLPDNADFVGRLEIVDIGFPPEVVEEAKGEPGLELIHPAELAELFPRRSRTSHKGSYGHVLCVGGSPGYGGAICMALRAAARSGVGLVSGKVPESIHLQVASSVPESMVFSDAPEEKWTAVLAGPGMGRSAETREAVAARLAVAGSPLLLDADALTVWGAEGLDALAAAKRPLVLTPHPGEFAAIFGLTPAEVQADRIALVRMAADRLKCVVVLKGAGTLVAAPGRPVAVNPTGNPGMAVGGSGDVLAGLVAGLLAQGIDPYAAACAGVWLHGHAGDLAAGAGSQAGLVATDLLGRLPDAFRALSPR